MEEKRVVRAWEMAVVLLICAVSIAYGFGQYYW
jgi:hypothetical protein